MGGVCGGVAGWQQHCDGLSSGCGRKPVRRLFRREEDVLQMPVPPSLRWVWEGVEWRHEGLRCLRTLSHHPEFRQRWKQENGLALGPDDLALSASFAGLAGVHGHMAWPLAVSASSMKWVQTSGSP